MQKYKALMLDLDGTTIPNRRDGLPSKKVMHAIEQAQKVIRVCAVTARPLHVALPVITMLNLSSVCVIDGGGQIFDPVMGKVLWEQALEKSDADLLWKFAKDNKLVFLFSDGSPLDPTKGKKPEKMLDIVYQSLTNEQADQYITDFSHIPTLSFHKIVSWDNGKIALKISHAKATKQHGVVFVAEKLGINTHEMIGVGDGYNDFPLLMACGLKIAMGNAVDDLKAIADYIAPSVDDDGVVDIIERFVLR